jgi:hypothetical protein
MGALLALFLLGGLAVVFVLVVPLLLIKLVASLVLLPFKILGGLLKGIGKLAFGLFGLLAGLLAVFVLVVALPLVPVVLVGGVIWLLTRRSRPANANGLMRV